jgi:uncharacterized protein with FMN-binding domain
MNKIVVSLLVVAASAAYVSDRPGVRSAGYPSGPAPSNGGSQTSVVKAGPRATVAETLGSFRADLDLTRPANESRLVGASIVQAVFLTSESERGLRAFPVWTLTAASQPASPNTRNSVWADAGPSVTLVQLTQPVSPATPTAPPSQPPATPPNTPQFRDGTYTGSPANAYYGTVQVRVVVKNGQVASIDVLNYPSDRSTSRQINSYALPQLQREVVQAFQAQSARIRIISGATLTTEAYLNSVQSALKQALVVQAPAAGST